MIRRNQSENSIFDLAEIPHEEISDAKALIKDPMVSVRIVTYNHAPYIGQAIEGVLRQQTYYPYELVVGEDCSTDTTRKIVLKYQRKHPHIIRVITSACNVGAKRNCWRIDNALRGRYVAFCDGDDYWHHPQKLQKQIDYLQTHQNVGLVHSGMDFASIQSPARRARRRAWAYYRSVLADEKNLFLEIMLCRYRLGTSSVCVRRALFESVIRSDPEVYQSDRFVLSDLALWLDFSRRTQFQFFDESLATYRILSESASRSKDPARVKEYTLNVFDLRSYYLNKYSSAVDDSERSRILRFMASQLLRSGFALNDYEMVRIGKDTSEKAGFESSILYHAVANRFLRTAFLPIRRIANKRWASGAGFLKAAQTGG
jgi:glycosyltransferase involved in cell wall biosynthesis